MCLSSISPNESSLKNSPGNPINRVLSLPDVIGINIYTSSTTRASYLLKEEVEAKDAEAHFWSQKGFLIWLKVLKV